MTDVDTGLQDIAAIRSIMERSTKFLSLSGYAGIGAGLLALAGAWAAGTMIAADIGTLTYATTAKDLGPDTPLRLVLLGVSILLLALVIVWLFSRRIVRKHAEPVHGPVMRQMLLAFSVPVLAGACMTLLLFFLAPLWTVVPAMLVFYGIGVFSAGSFTFSEVRTLGFLEILLGLAAGFTPALGIHLWAAGFGVLHIFYGALFFRKYRQ